VIYLEFSTLHIRRIVPCGGLEPSVVIEIVAQSGHVMVVCDCVRSGYFLLYSAIYGRVNRRTLLLQMPKYARLIDRFRVACSLLSLRTNVY